MALVPYKPLYINEILDSKFRFDSSSPTDLNMDESVNENDGSDGVDKDGLFGSGTHVDVEMGADDVDVSRSVPTHQRDVSNNDKQMEVPISSDFNQVAEGVATRGSTQAP